MRRRVMRSFGSWRGGSSGHRVVESSARCVPKPERLGQRRGWAESGDRQSQLTSSMRQAVSIRIVDQVQWPAPCGKLCALRLQSKPNDERRVANCQSINATDTVEVQRQEA
eukprot:123609-Chlamydomonas_euryale.AAC.7